MFDGIAPRYDLLNRLLSFGVDRGWRRRLVGAVRADERERILDVATGTGDLAFAISRKCPRAEATGLDLSEGMLEVARRKAAALEGGTRIEFLSGEAENLPFEGGVFDAVTAAFGVRNFHDIRAGLSEMARVLDHEGKIYILEFSTPRNRLFGRMYGWYFHRVLPVIGGMVSRDGRAYRYLPSSVDEFPPPEEFLRMMEDSGFSDCRCRYLTNGIACLYTGTKKTARAIIIFRKGVCINTIRRKKYA